MTVEQPLLGRAVLVTRGLVKGDRLGELLEALGARVTRVPLIQVERLEGATGLAPAVARMADAGVPAWTVLTSQVAADLLIAAVDGAWPPGVSVAAVGPATAAALAAGGIGAELVSAGQTAEALGRELSARGVAGASILIVAAAGGQDCAAPPLRAAGAVVETIEAYRSVLPAKATEDLRSALAARAPDAVTFTSGSTVRNFSAAAGRDSLPGCPAVCIGPVTAAVAQHAGWSPVVTAVEHTTAGVAEATVRALGAQQVT